MVKSVLKNELELRDQVIRSVDKMYSFNPDELEVSERPNKLGLFELTCKGNVRANKKLTTLTDGTFTWVKVQGSFDCSECNLVSLEGSPKEVGADFDCSHCHELVSLAGGPLKVNGNFKCRCCHKLTSLIGAPEVVAGNFTCFNCMQLLTLEGISVNPMPVSIDCSHCYRLQSLGPIPIERMSRVNITYCDDLYKINK